MEISSIIGSIHGPDWMNKFPKKKILSDLPITSILENVKVKGYYSIENPFNLHDNPNLEERLREPTQKEMEFFDKLIREYGVHVLAFYISFHNDPHNWGVYILDFAPEYLSKKVFPMIHPVSGKKAAIETLIYHEYFHFITEMGLTVLEAPSDYHLIYNRYYDKKISGTYSESLANAYTFNQFTKKRHHFFAECGGLKDFMKSQPKYYSEFELYLKAEDFQKGLRKLGNDCASFGRNLSEIPPMEIIFDVNDNYLSVRDVPMRIVKTQSNI